MTALGVLYVAGILPNTLMWRPGSGPRRKDKPLNNTGRRDEPDLVSAKEVVLALPKQAWRTVAWREGSADRLSSRFARVRVRVGYNKLIPEQLSPEWLLIEWPEGEAEPTKYWLSTLPETISFERLVDLAKLRWRIERDYQELKQEVGLDHYEGCGWRGFHHHATASQPTTSWSPSRRRRQSRYLAYPTIIAPKAPPVRPERHVPNSITTMRVRLIRMLIKTVPRCPCCGVGAASNGRRRP